MNSAQTVTAALKSDKACASPERAQLNKHVVENRRPTFDNHKVCNNYRIAFSMASKARYVAQKLAAQINGDTMRSFRQTAYLSFSSQGRQNSTAANKLWCRKSTSRAIYAATAACFWQFLGQTRAQDLQPMQSSLSCSAITIISSSSS